MTESSTLRVITETYEEKSAIFTMHKVGCTKNDHRCNLCSFYKREMQRFERMKRQLSKD